jgi:hypothetical protein
MANFINLFVFQQSVSGTGAMHRLGVCWLAVLMASACVPEYRQPDLREPHAVAKLRLAYHAWSGPMLEQTVMVDGSRVRNMPAPVQGGKGVATHAVLLRPGTVRWTIQTAFFHNDVSTHAETYTSDETRPCADTACMQSAPQARNVNKVDRVDDATCEAGMKHTALAGEIYLVQFDFFADRRCSVQCFRQVSRPGGTIANAPCEGA